MLTIKQTQIKYCFRALFLSGFTAILFLALEFKEICKGIILGSFFSILNFNLIGPSFSLKLKKSNTHGISKIFKYIDIRHMIAILPITFSLLHDQYNLWAVLFGLFSVQFVLLTDHISDYLIFTKSTKT